MADWQPYYYSFSTPEGQAGLSNSVLAPRNSMNPAMWANNPVYPGGMPGLDVTDPTIYALMQSNPALANYITQQQQANEYFQSLNPSFVVPQDFGGAYAASGMTPEQLLAYLQSNYGGDASRRPEIVTDVNGQKYLKQWHDVSQSGGFLDKLTGLAEPIFALSGFAGPALGAEIAAGAAGGAMDMGVGGVGEAMGLGGGSGAATGAGALADAPWGVNPQTGTGMDFSNIGDILNFDEGFQLDPNQFNNFTGELLRDLSAGPSALNLQDVITKIDALPAGALKMALQAAMLGSGGRTDAAGQQTQGNSLASIFGTLGSTALGVYGANQQSQALRDIANQARADRAPFLNKATEWFNNPESYYSGEPAKAAMNATLRGLSVNGNPFGSGTSLALANEAGLRDWRNAWTGAANIGLSGQDSRNQLLASSAEANRGITSSIASGLGSLTQDNSLESILRKYGGNYLNSGSYLP